MDSDHEYKNKFKQAQTLPSEVHDRYTDSTYYDHQLLPFLIWNGLKQNNNQDGKVYPYACINNG